MPDSPDREEQLDAEVMSLDSILIVRKMIYYSHPTKRSLKARQSL
jgi:hypothetical protein